MLKIRRLAIDTHPENTAFLPRQGNGYSAEQFQALRKIRITGESAEILATLALVDEPALVEAGEIGLGEQAFRRLGLPEGLRSRSSRRPFPRASNRSGARSTATRSMKARSPPSFVMSPATAIHRWRSGPSGCLRRLHEHRGNARHDPRDGGRRQPARLARAARRRQALHWRHSGTARR